MFIILYIIKLFFTILILNLVNDVKTMKLPLSYVLNNNCKTLNNNKKLLIIKKKILRTIVHFQKLERTFIKLQL